MRKLDLLSSVCFDIEVELRLRYLQNFVNIIRNLTCRRYRQALINGENSNDIVLLTQVLSYRTWTKGTLDLGLTIVVRKSSDKHSEEKTVGAKL